MKRTMLILLLCTLLAITADAGATYDTHKVTRGDATYAFGWTICPLDAGNAVVIARTDKDIPWHVTWYREGELYRDLAGYAASPYLEDRVIPRPVIWKNGQLTMVWSERKEAYRTIQDESGRVGPDPDNYDTYLGEWTENGLEKREKLPEKWYDTVELGKALILHENGVFRILIDGKEAALPEEIEHLPEEKIMNLNCWPVDENVLLLSFFREDDSMQHIVCVDHGTKKYDVEIDIMESWLLLADGYGGFFNKPDGVVTEPYEPVCLTHYGADGRKDRDICLKGDRVIIRPQGTIAGPDGSLVLYGSAVAESRQVYSVFTMTLDENMKMTALDVRNIDPTYNAYNPYMEHAPDGTVWVLIFTVESTGYGRPVMIPFERLEKSEDDRGLMLE